MKEIVTHFKKRKAAIVGLIIFLLFVIVGVLGPYIAPYSPYEKKFSDRFGVPTTKHLLGTDWAGRDTLSRILVGTRISLRIAGLALALGAILGSLIGIISGFMGGAFDNVIMRLNDIWLSFPFLVLAILITAILGPSLNNAIIAIGFARIPRYARLMRSVTLSKKEEVFVEAAEAIGASGWHIIVKHIVPNIFSTFVVNTSLNLGLTLISEATLSFIGLGAQPPLPSWGIMVRQASENIFAFPFGVFPPVFAILLVVLSTNLMADGLREALDPKQRYVS